jgi:predicted sulfurtransferase
MQVYVATEGVNAQMAVPDTALPYFEAATRAVPVFASMRLNTDHVVSRADFITTRPFRA